MIYVLLLHFVRAYVILSLVDQALTLKHWEMHGCVVSTVATDDLVLKAPGHQYPQY